MGNIVGEKKINLIKNNLILLLSRYFTAIVLIFSLIVIILGLIIFIKPKYETVKNEISKTKETDTAEYLKQSALLEELKKIKESYDKINQDDVKKLDLMVPNGLDKEELLAQLEKIMNKNGLLYSTLAVKDAGAASTPTEKSGKEEQKAPAKVSSGQGEIKSVSISLPFSGVSYSGFKNILEIFQNNLRLMDIKNLSYKPGLTGADISFEIVAYYVE